MGRLTLAAELEDPLPLTGRHGALTGANGSRRRAGLVRQVRLTAAAAAAAAVAQSLAPFDRRRCR